MKVPLGDLKVHYQTYKEIFDEAVQRVLQSGHFILGEELEKFETEFARFIGADYAVGCASGTDAIYLALAACEIAQGDEVIVVSHTAVPTISAISMAGATPVFVDIDPSSYLMDTKQIEAKITARSKAIIPVHLYGQVVDMEPLVKIRARHNLVIIEDVAQATGATYGGVKAGSLGDAAAFSFYPSKNLGAFGDGGAVVTKNASLYRRLMMLRNIGQSQRYYHDIIGINSRLGEIQAAILSAQLPFVAAWNNRRIEIATRYTAGLKDVVQTPNSRPGNGHVYHLYVIQAQEREKLQSFLAGRGINTLIHYPIPAHMQKAYECLGYKKGDLPNTERIAERIVSLPMFPELTNEQVDYVIEAISDFYQGGSDASASIRDDKAQSKPVVAGSENLVCS